MGYVVIFQVIINRYKFFVDKMIELMGVASNNDLFLLEISKKRDIQNLTPFDPFETCIEKVKDCRYITKKI